MTVLHTEPLTAKTFAPFGDVLECKSEGALKINQGLCDRYHDLARLDFGGGQAGISIFHAQPRNLPYTLNLLERHPLGSQAFVPMYETSFLVIVAPDDNGLPGQPRAFLSSRGQGINFHRGIWHGVLTPLDGPGLFAVVDRIGSENNLEEFRLTKEVKIV